MIWTASILCMSRRLLQILRDLETVAGKYQRDRPLAGIRMHEGAADARLDVLVLADDAKGNAQGLQERLHCLGMIDRPPVPLAEIAAVAHDHDERHVVGKGVAGDRLAGLPQSRVLHDHERLFAAEISPRADAREIRLVAGEHIADRILLAKKAMDPLHMRVRSGRYDGNARFLPALHEQLRIFGDFILRLYHWSLRSIRWTLRQVARF